MARSIGSVQSAAVCSLGGQDSHSLSYVLWQMGSTLVQGWAAPCSITQQHSAACSTKQRMFGLLPLL